MPLTRPVAGDPVVAEDFGQPVYDYIVANAPTAWQNLSLSSGWANFGGTRSPSRFRKIGDNLQLVVAVGTNTAAEGSSCGVLPSGYRPLYVYDIVVRCGGSQAAYGIANLMPDGNILIYKGSGAGADMTLVVFAVIVPTT